MDYLRDESIVRGAGKSTVKRKFYGRILDIDSLKMLKEKRDLFYVLSFLIHNTKPVGHQVYPILSASLGGWPLSFNTEDI